MTFLANVPDLRTNIVLISERIISYNEVCTFSSGRLGKNNMGRSPHPASFDEFFNFGDMLKYLRRRERLTQLELSIAVGYSEAHISRLEKNKRLPDLATLKALFIPALHLQDEPHLTARFLYLAQSARQQDTAAAAKKRGDQREGQRRHALERPEIDRQRPLDNFYMI